MNRVDDFRGLLDKFLAGHGLHRQLFDFGDSSLLCFSSSATPVPVEDTAGFDAEQLNKYTNSYSI